jgi:hypothetical protein
MQNTENCLLAIAYQIAKKIGNATVFRRNDSGDGALGISPTNLSTSLSGPRLPRRNTGP